MDSPLKRARKTLQRSQQDVADDLHIRVETYCRWETGAQTPSDRNKRRLVRYFKQDFGILFPDYSHAPCTSSVAHAT